jgi:hypothetical protein
VDLQPADFIEQAARAETWDEGRWHQWQALQERLTEFGVGKLKLRGRLLTADTEPLRNFTPSTVELKPGESILDAINRLVHQLSPEPLGTHRLDPPT